MTAAHMTWPEPPSRIVELETYLLGMTDAWLQIPHSGALAYTMLPCSRAFEL